MGLLSCVSLVFAGCGAGQTSKAIASDCPVKLVVLGAGQDAGAPQIGNPNDPAWSDPSQRLYATSLALIDPVNGKRYLFEATPDMREQMQILDQLAPPDPNGPYLDGIFLTHAHIGHYAGLMFLGRESMGAKGVPVYALPRMKDYLENNGPWSQLVELGNIELQSLNDVNPGAPLVLSEGINVFPWLAPHRDEFSETVGYFVKAGQSSFLFLPDLDSWQEWNDRLASYSFDGWHFPKVVTMVDHAFLDATFYDDNELPGRDMSQIPHPRVTTTMGLVEQSGLEGAADKIRFIHINHTNPLRDKNSAAYKDMKARGFHLSERGDEICL